MSHQTFPQLATLRDQAALLERRCDILRRQIAAYGLLAPAALQLELQEAEKQLENCHSTIARAENAAPSDRPPYLGLRAFGEENADLFFGREHISLELARKLEHKPLITIFGASGVGKSSIVHAGLLPLLHEDTRRGIQRWRIVAITPGPRPLDALAAGLARLHAHPLDVASKYSTDFAHNRHALLLLSKLLLDERAGERLLIVIDQAEEIWTRAPADAHDHIQWLEQQQRPLLDVIAATVDGNSLAAPQVVFVLVMRKEFIPHILDHPQLGELAKHELVRVPALKIEDIRTAIVRPAEIVGCHVQTSLVNELLKEVHGGPAELPLLQYALLELWQQRSPLGELSLEAFQAMGGVAGALARAAEQLLEQHFAESARQTQLRNTLLRLVQPGDGTPDTRRRISLADLATPTMSTADVRMLMAPLEYARLVVVSASNTPGEALMELAHEALIRSWPRFHSWVEASRTTLRVQLQIEEAAREWHTNQCADDFLWQGRRLAQISAWREQAQPQLNLRAIDFLAACRERSANASPPRELRRHPQDAAQLSFLQSLQLAEHAQHQAAHDFDLALLLAGEALARHDNTTTQQTVRSLLALRNLGTHEISWQNGRILRVAFGPAGETLVALADEQLVSLYDANKRLLLQFPGHNQPVLDLAFSPDHQQIATTSYDKTVRLWPRNGQGSITLAGHTGAVNSVAFSADNTMIATSSADKTARLWDRRGQHLATLQGHSANVLKALFSPNCERLLTISDDHTARLWDTRGHPIATLRGHGARLLDAAFSPDSAWIATATYDASARLWNAQGGLHAQLQGHTNAITSIRFLEDAQTLASTSADHTARLWNAAGVAWSVMHGHAGGITCLALSPNNQQLATGSYDSSIRLWDRAGECRAQLHGHTNAIISVHFTPNGQQVVSAALDRTLRHTLANAEALLSVISACVRRSLSEDEITRFDVPQPYRFGPALSS